MTVDPRLFDSVCARAREATTLQTAADALEWDERTGMPAAAGEFRAIQVSTLRGLAHRIRTAGQYAEDLQRLHETAADEDPHGDQAATIRGLFRDWDRDRKLPTELVERVSQATVRGGQRWDAARKAEDYTIFRDSLATIIELKRQVGERLREGTALTAYETLLDEYEPDARVDRLEQIFDELRQPLVELVARLADAPRQPDTAAIRGAYSIERQHEFSRRVAQCIGFDFDRGRLDETAHPFCTTLGPNDCRILTRYDSQWLPSGLFGTMHEAGHGMYEQGLRREWFGLPPGSPVSLGIHESQSRLWENQVGRSRAFWQWLYPETQRWFAPQLDGVSLDDFHFAINAVRPSLIRVEADEVTYNLHIILRFDLERKLIDGSLSVTDLPEAWNDRYHRDLGVRPASAAEGVLQDVHWSAGLFGYFPTYTLGNLAAAQLFRAADQQLDDLPAQFASGQFQPLREWLREKIHCPGRCFSGAQLIERASGSPLSASHLVEELESKLQLLYGISL
jgi:carboxypeptidase Taq